MNDDNNATTTEIVKNNDLEKQKQKELIYRRLSGNLFQKMKVTVQHFAQSS